MSSTSPPRDRHPDLVGPIGQGVHPRKDVISLRNLFSTRIALRLDESEDRKSVV